MICFRGTLPPDVGVSFVNRLDAETDRECRVARREGRFESRAAHAADAFVRMLEGAGKRKARSADLVIVQDLRAHRRGHTHPGEVSHIIGGGPIPVRVARERGKDAFLKVVLHDGVQIHTVKHFGRYRPADRRYHLQWDHKDPCANDGATSHQNLQPLCVDHHWDKTERDRKAGLLKGKSVGRGPP